uniref:Uncharacterized protein n=1 Tax=Romanomermis culicivorax TaxID=13658 RepID=A0A915ILE4_ROMCU
MHRNVYSCNSVWPKAAAKQFKFPSEIFNDKKLSSIVLVDGARFSTSKMLRFPEVSQAMKARFLLDGFSFASSFGSSNSREVVSCEGSFTDEFILGDEIRVNVFGCRTAPRLNARTFFCLAIAYRSINRTRIARHFQVST